MTFHRTEGNKWKVVFGFRSRVFILFSFFLSPYRFPTWHAMILQIRVHYRRINKGLGQKVMSWFFVLVIVKHSETGVAPE